MAPNPAPWLPLFAGALLVLAGCNPDLDRVPEVSAQQGTKPDNPRSTAANELPAQAAESADDAALSAKVESALKAEPQLHGTSIVVRSQGGTVTLSGSTKDPELRAMAAQVALSVEGVKLVRNEIELAREA